MPTPEVTTSRLVAVDTSTSPSPRSPSFVQSKDTSPAMQPTNYHRHGLYYHKVAKSLGVLDYRPTTIELPAQDPRSPCSELAPSLPSTTTDSTIASTPELILTHENSSTTSINSLPLDSLTHLEFHSVTADDADDVTVNYASVEEAKGSTGIESVASTTEGQDAGTTDMLAYDHIDFDEWLADSRDWLVSRSFRRVALTYCDLCGPNAQTLFDLLNSCDSTKANNVIEEIDFGYNSRLGADLEAIRALARLIHANRDSLRVLKLDRVGLTDKGLALLVETLVGSTVAGTNTFPLPSLRSLYLRGNRFGTAGISLLSRFLSLPLPSFPGGETRCYAADYHCHCCNSRLEGLYLGYNSTIDPVGLADLATCVQRLPSLRHLGLGAIATTGICYRAPGDTGDHGGEDDGCPGLSELFTALAIHPAVTHLFLPRNSLGDHGIRVLFQALRPNGVLRHLSIACNGITAVGAQHIAEWIGTYAPSSLVTIDLSDNPLGDLGIQRIAAGLAKRPVAGNCATSPADNHHHNRHHQHLCRGGGIPHLRNLVLCACFITDVGVSALASALSSNRSLERINLGYNSRISHKGYHLLCDLAKNNPFLQQIIIGSSPTSIPVTTADHIPVGSSAIAFDDADPIGVLNAILLRNSQHIAHRQEWLGRIVAFVKQHRTCIAAAPVVDASIQLDSMIAAQHGLPLPDNSHQWKEYLGGSFGISYPTDWFTLLQLVLLNSDDDEEVWSHVELHFDHWTRAPRPPLPTVSFDSSHFFRL